MSTSLGNYLSKLKVNKAKLSRETGLTTDRINALCNEHDSILYADELYSILTTVNEDFNTSIEQIFKGRTKKDLIAIYSGQSAFGDFLRRFTLKQKDIAEKLDIPASRLSKLINDPSKRPYASELYDIAKGLELNIYEVFREVLE